MVQTRMFSLEELPIKNKTVLLRCDYNVSIENKKIKDTTKLKSSLSTINYLLKQHCTIIIASHLGRPKGKVVPSLRMNPIANALQKMLPKVTIKKLDDCIGKKVNEKIKKIVVKNTKLNQNKKRTTQKQTIILLENVRFYSEELENDYAFAHSLANLAQFFINDAFGAIHRNHASISAITKFLPAAPGFLVQTEILNLHHILRPKKPAIWIIGGAKLDKIDLFESALEKADNILVGGALCFSFLKAKGIGVGHSKIDNNTIKIAKKILKHKNAKKIVLPIDFVTAKTMSTIAKRKTKAYNDISPDEIALDLGPKTSNLFDHYIQKANTILWNGPLGYIELTPYQKGTKKLIASIVKSKAISITGGGETLEIINKYKASKKFTHISTGGGATVSFVAGNILAGIKALKNNYTQFKKSILKK
jgi:3-phosphoglycerate kinase